MNHFYADLKKGIGMGNLYRKKKKCKVLEQNMKTPLVQKEIIDLEKKIHLFQEGKVDEERFRSLRLARGIYGQRQPGVQMIQY